MENPQVVLRSIWRIGSDGWLIVLYLTFDVHGLEGLTFSGFEHGAGLASKESEFVVLLLEEFLAVVVTDKLGGVAVGFESKLLGDES